MQTSTIDKCESDPWSVRVDQLTPDASVDERVMVAVRLASLAPSTHNTQPWRFRCDHKRIDLLADVDRTLTVSDPVGRERTISCGAAAQTLHLALAAVGLAHRFRVLPSPVRPDIIASFDLLENEDPPTIPRSTIDAMTQRTTNRGPFTSPVWPVTVLEHLRRMSSTFGVNLVFASQPEHAALGEVIADADRLQLRDPAFRRELTQWMHGNWAVACDDGVSGESLGLNDVDSVLALALYRTFDVGERFAAKDFELATGSPILAVLESPNDLPHDWVATGRALTALLLALTVRGAAASFLNQPIEVVGLRPRVAEILGSNDTPQLILRIGMPTKSFPHTPRRRLRDLVLPVDDEGEI